MVRCVLTRSGGVLLAALLGTAPVYALDVKPGLWEISMDTAEPSKACFTQEFLDTDISDMKMPEGVECTNEYKEKSSKLVIAHAVCTGTLGAGTIAIEGETRLEVLSAESMTMQSNSVMNFGGQQQPVSTSAQYKWLSSDCGDVKPIDLKNAFK
jgi:hypothetical protein